MHIENCALDPSQPTTLTQAIPPVKPCPTSCCHIPQPVSLCDLPQRQILKQVKDSVPAAVAYQSCNIVALRVPHPIVHNIFTADLFNINVQVSRYRSS